MISAAFDLTEKLTFCFRAAEHWFVKTSVVNCGLRIPTSPWIQGGSYERENQ
jgi:hypothetical protein